MIETTATAIRQKAVSHAYHDSPLCGVDDGPEPASISRFLQAVECYVTETLEEDALIEFYDHWRDYVSVYDDAYKAWWQENVIYKMLEKLG